MVDEMTKKNALSVVTATYNRKEILRMNLEHLARQTLASDTFEVVVVDDGSSDGTADMVVGMQQILPYRLRFHQQQHKGPGAAHNRGVRESESNIVLFLANDMLPTPALLESHLNIHRANPQAHVAVVGKLAESGELPQTAFQKAWDPFLGRGMEGKENLNELDFWVSNLSMKRDFFLEKGVFIEYPGPAMEDHELAYRLFRRGLKLMYCGQALAYHYHPQTLESALARVYATGKNFTVYENLVPDDAKVQEFAHVLSPRLGTNKFLKILIRDMCRLCFFNGITVPSLVIPLIKRAESDKFLEPYVRFLTRRACGYYFRKGVSAGRKERGKK